ncbi:MAG: PAS domain S-box protein, partial [Lentimicrobium sp.]|nr:PAS domain S-box protein [Lentimicrobium sp.]
MDKCSYRDVVFNAPFAYACHKINFDRNGIVVDAIIAEANERFAVLCKSSPPAIKDQRLSELLPELKTISDNWPQLMAGIATGGNSTEFTIQFIETGKRFNIQVYSPGKDLCVTLFHEIIYSDSSSGQLPEDGKRCKALFDTMNQGVVYQNSDGIITSANPAAERILGLTLDQLQGRTSIDPRWKSIREDGTDYPGNEHPIMIALKTGKADMGRVMGINNPVSNDTRWIIVDGIPDFRDGETSPYQAHAIFTDTTERLLAEKTIKESERKITTLINNINGLVYRCRNDHDWTMEFLSDGITKLTGYPKDDFIDNRVRSYNSIIHKDDRQSIWNKTQTSITENEHFQLEYRIYHANGTLKWVLENGCGIFENGQLVALEGYITDITEKKTAESALKESEEKFRAVFVASPDLVSITSLSDGRYVEVNDAFITQSGFRRSEIIGNTAFNLNIWHNQDDRIKLTNILKRQGYVINFEAKFRLKDNRVFPGLMSASILN